MPARYSPPDYERVWMTTQRLRVETRILVAQSHALILRSRQLCDVGPVYRRKAAFLIAFASHDIHARAPTRHDGRHPHRASGPSKRPREALQLPD